MNKKENRIAVRQAAAKAVVRDEQNRCIRFAATNPAQEVLKNLHTTRREPQQIRRQQGHP